HLRAIDDRLSRIGGRRVNRPVILEDRLEVFGRAIAVLPHLLRTIWKLRAVNGFASREGGPEQEQSRHATPYRCPAGPAVAVNDTSHRDERIPPVPGEIHAADQLRAIAASMRRRVSSRPTISSVSPMPGLAVPPVTATLSG